MNGESLRWKIADSARRGPPPPKLKGERDFKKMTSTIDDDALRHIFWTNLHLALDKPEKHRYHIMKRLALVDRRHARIWRETLYDFQWVDATVAKCGHRISRHFKCNRFVTLRDAQAAMCDDCAGVRMICVDYSASFKSVVEARPLHPILPIPVGWTCRRDVFRKLICSDDFCTFEGATLSEQKKRKVLKYAGISVA